MKKLFLNGSPKRRTVSPKGLWTRRVLSISVAVVALIALVLSGCPDESKGVYTCANGTPVTGTLSGSTNVERCQSCATGYSLSGVAGADGVTCVKDAVDTTKPTFSAAPAVDGDETATTATVKFTASEAGKVFWILYADGATATTDVEAFIAAASGTTVVGVQQSGANKTVTTAAETVALTGLNAGTTYDFYAVLQDSAGNNGAAISAVLEITTAEAVSNATCGANASATTSVKLIWGDADYGSTDCAEIELQDPAFAFFVEGEDSTKDIKDTDEASGGADGSSTNRKVELIKDSAGWGGTTAFLKAQQDFSDAGWVLKIAIKSPNSGGNSKIKAKLESLETPDNPNDPKDIATLELEKSFTNDGTWQTVEWPISEFNFDAEKIDSSKIGKVVIVLSDANGATAGIGAQTVYYDEIRFEKAPDKTPPTFSAAPALDGRPTATAANVKLTADEAGKVFWVLYADSDASPDNAAALIAAASGSDAGEQRSGASVAVTTAEKTVALTGLTAGATYNFYAVLQDSAGNNGAVSAKVEITTAATADETPPTFSAAPAAGISAINGVTVTLTADEAGKVFWVLYADGDASPDNAAALIKDATGDSAGVARSGDSVAVTTTAETVTILGLALNTNYDFYAVLQDSAGNNGAPSTKLDVATLAALPDTLVVYGDTVGAGAGRLLFSTIVVASDANALVRTDLTGTATCNGTATCIRSVYTGGWGGFAFEGFNIDASSYAGVRVTYKLSGGDGFRVALDSYKADGTGQAQRTIDPRTAAGDVTADDDWYTYTAAFSSLVVSPDVGDLEFGFNRLKGLGIWHQGANNTITVDEVYLVDSTTDTN